MKEKNEIQNDNITEEQIPAKIRVYSLAKMLGTSSKEIIGLLNQQGIVRKNAHSNIDREHANIVKELLQRGTQDAVEQVPSSTSPRTSVSKTSPVPSPEDVSDTLDNQGTAQKTRRNSKNTRNTSPQPQLSESFASTSEDSLFSAAITPVTPPPPKKTRIHDYQNFFLAPKFLPRSSDAFTPDENDGKNNEGLGLKIGRRGKRGRGRGRKQSVLANEIYDENASGEFLADINDPKIREIRSNLANIDITLENDQPTHMRRTRKRKKSEITTDTSFNDSVLGDDISDSITETTAEDGSKVIVHERPHRRPANAHSNGPSAINGSARMVAKRQRRRELRRSKPAHHSISQEEFLARRKAIERIMVVREKTSAHNEQYTQVGVLEDGVLVEHFVTTEAFSSLVGNVYLGEIQNVLPSMEAAFVNIGQERNAVLYSGEVDWEASGLAKKDRRIEEALTPGKQVLVQVTKDPVGQKGARLTTQISLAGRYLVFVPGNNSIGISRRLPEIERRRLKELLTDILPEDSGVIVRTAAEGVSPEDFAADLERLRKQWEDIQSEVNKTKDSSTAVVKTIYEEPDFLVKVIRDLFNEDFTKLVIHGDGPWKTVENYLSTVSSDLMNKVHKWTEDPENPVDFFAQYKIEEQLSKALNRKVWLPSGGTLIIERTEAMTVIDVNTGKFVGEGGNLEETVTRNNLEAAEEIVHQLRLRDIGGMIIIDFIDMIMPSNQDLVLAKLEEEFSKDRTRHQISEVTSLGLVQITRKKIGTGLFEAFTTQCPHCHGKGYIVHSDPVEDDAEEEYPRSNKRGNRKGRGKNNNGSSAGRSSSSSRSSHSTNNTNKEEEPSTPPANPASHPLFKALAKQHGDDSENSATPRTEHTENETAAPSPHDHTASQGATTLVESSTPNDYIADTSDDDEQEATLAAELTEEDPNTRRKRKRKRKRKNNQSKAASQGTEGVETTAKTENAEKPADDKDSAPRDTDASLPTAETTETKTSSHSESGVQVTKRVRSRNSRAHSSHNTATDPVSAVEEAEATAHAADVTSPAPQDTSSPSVSSGSLAQEHDTKEKTATNNGSGTPSQSAVPHNTDNEAETSSQAETRTRPRRRKVVSTPVTQTDPATTYHIDVSSPTPPVSTNSAQEHSSTVHTRTRRRAVTRAADAGQSSAQ